MPRKLTFTRSDLPKTGKHSFQTEMESVKSGQSSMSSVVTEDGGIVRKKKNKKRLKKNQVEDGGEKPAVDETYNKTSNEKVVKDNSGMSFPT